MFVHKKKAVIVDLDGTICNIKPRLHHIVNPEGKKNWDAFNEAIPNDLPKWDIINLVNILSDVGHRIIIVTGRFERYSHLTTAWLKDHGVQWDGLYMRKDGDYRSDFETKKDHLVEIQAKWEVRLVLDDRDSVVKMWRDQGLTCLQVQKGDY